MAIAGKPAEVETGAGQRTTMDMGTGSPAARKSTAQDKSASRKSTVPSKQKAQEPAGPVVADVKVGSIQLPGTFASVYTKKS